MLENATLMIDPDNFEHINLTYSLPPSATFDFLLVTMTTYNNTKLRNYQVERNRLKSNNYIKIYKIPLFSAIITLKLNSQTAWSKPVSLNFIRPSLPSVIGYNHSITQEGTTKITIYFTIDYEKTEKLRVTLCVSNLIECKQSLHRREEELEQIIEVKEKAVGTVNVSISALAISGGMNSLPTHNSLIIGKLHV